MSRADLVEGQKVRGRWVVAEVLRMMPYLTMKKRFWPKIVLPLPFHYGSHVSEYSTIKVYISG